MALSFTVGSAKATFEGPYAHEVAGVLDNAFGAEGEWEGVAPRCFGEVCSAGWTDLRRRAIAELGEDGVPNLLAVLGEARGVYLPTHVRAVSLPLSRGKTLVCGSLPGLRTELAELAERWDLSLKDEHLQSLLPDPDDAGGLADAPEIAAFARLALAANEAVRRDCPLWLVGEE